MQQNNIKCVMNMLSVIEIDVQKLSKERGITYSQKYYISQYSLATMRAISHSTQGVSKSVEGYEENSQVLLNENPPCLKQTLHCKLSLSLITTRCDLTKMPSQESCRTLTLSSPTLSGFHGKGVRTFYKVARSHKAKVTPKQLFKPR